MPMPQASIAPQVVGQHVRALRLAIGWSQHELAKRAGISQPHLSRIERAARPDLTFATAEALLRALGARLAISVEAPYLADRRSQRDPAHARLVAAVLSRLRRSGWTGNMEVEVGGDRSRGWIDILAFHPSTRAVLVIEVKTEIHDLGSIVRTLTWYEREAGPAARRLGWRPASVAGCLLLLGTEVNDARAAANRAALADAFPVRAHELQACLDRGATPARRSVAMIDPRARRSTWCRPLRIDGRRATAPYADYAAFMRRTGR
ncbi:MAG: helix-turn-helix transcriptional regulator [Chloroflexi bacterium]|nr:helix-turn-helix transcriptional regulator [Chloroflexota bacterium]